PPDALPIFTLGIGKIPAVLSKHLALGLSPGICVVIDHAENTRIVCLARAIGAGENPIENQITERPQIITVLLMLLLDLIKLMDSTTQCLPLLQFLVDNGLQAGIVYEIVLADPLHHSGTQLNGAVILQQHLPPDSTYLVDSGQLLLQ